MQSAAPTSTAGQQMNAGALSALTAKLIIEDGQGPAQRAAPGASAGLWDEEAVTGSVGDIALPAASAGFQPVPESASNGAPIGSFRPIQRPAKPAPAKTSLPHVPEGQEFVTTLAGLEEMSGAPAPAPRPVARPVPEKPAPPRKAPAALVESRQADPVIVSDSADSGAGLVAAMFSIRRH